MIQSIYMGFLTWSASITRVLGVLGSTVLRQSVCAVKMTFCYDMGIT